MTNPEQPEQPENGLNPNNSMTRADTFGIRPDLYQRLTEVIPKRPEVDQLIEDARKALERSQEALDDAAAAREVADEALTDSGEALSQAADARSDADAALTRSDAALSEAEGARGDARTALSNSRTALDEARDAVDDAGRAREDASGALSSAADARSDANASVTVARAADLRSEEGKVTAITANTNAIVSLTQASAANSRAIDAVSTSSAANSRAITANSRAIGATNQAVQSVTIANAANSKAIQSTNSAVSALVVANEANSSAIAATNRAVAAVSTSSAANSRAIEATNEAADNALEIVERHESMLAEIEELQKQTLQQLSYTFGASSSEADDHWTVTFNNGNLTITAKGTWTGKVTVTRILQGGSTSDRVYETVHSTHSVPGADGSRTIHWSRDLGARTTNHSVLLNYTVDPGVQRTHSDGTGAVGAPSQSSWETISSLTHEMPADGTRATVYFNCGWAAATFTDNYGIRVLRTRGSSQIVIGRVGPHANLGPVTPLGNGHRYQWITLHNQSFQEGDLIEFQRYSSAGSSSQRQIRDTSIKVTWIENGS